MVVLAEDLAEYLFEPFQGKTRKVFFVKALIGQVKLFTKRFAVKEGLSVQSEDVIGGCKDRREVVHECPRPVEDEIANHSAILA